MTRPRVALTRISLVFVGVCLALSLAEVSMRCVSTPLRMNKVSFDQFDWLVYDPILGWMNKAQYHAGTININHIHLRGRETSIQKPPDVLRIICLGDSRTFGIWTDLGRVRFNNAYPSVLEGLAQNNPSASHVEVMNAGVVGYSSSHGVRQLVTQLLRLQPDVIIVAFGVNDHVPSWNAALRCREPHNVVLRQLLYSLDDLRLFQFCTSVYQGMAALRPPPMGVRWVEPEEYAYNLQRFAQISRARGIRLLFLNQALRPIELGDSLPAFRDSEKRPKDEYAVFGARDLGDFHRQESEYQGILFHVAGEEGIPLADAAAAFAAHRGEPLFGPYYLVHPNPAGSQLIARTIYAKLLELGWLSSWNGSRVRPN